MTCKACNKCGVEKQFSEYYTNKRNKDGLQGACKACSNEITKKWCARHPEKRKAQQKDYNASEARKAIRKAYRTSEGCGVYLAKFPSGDYIGSGQIVGRRNDHMTGNSGTAKKLNEKAISFEVIFLVEPEHARVLEDRVIKHYGLDNLLNTKGAIQS